MMPNDAPEAASAAAVETRRKSRRVLPEPWTLMPCSALWATLPGGVPALASALAIVGDDVGERRFADGEGTGFVEQGNIGLRVANGGDGLDTVRGLGDNPDVVM